MNKTVIMGRKTYESLGQKLKGRRIIVLSNTINGLNQDYEVASSIDNVIEKVKNEKEIFIAGGGKLYKDTIEMANRIYITILDKEVDGIIYYPEVDMTKYKVTYEKYVSDACIPYTYYTYERK